MMVVELLSVEGCRSCARMRVVLERLASAFEGVSFTEIDLASDPGVAARYGVMACPAVVVDGRLRFVGGVDERALAAMFEAHASRR
jgi:thioredoxin-like negative regulator of GroEL